VTPIPEASTSRRRLTSVSLPNRNAGIEEGVEEPEVQKKAGEDNNSLASEEIIEERKKSWKKGEGKLIKLHGVSLSQSNSVLL
jgi:hypothetical protein